MLPTVIDILVTALSIYSYVLIIWIIAGLLVSLNIINRHEPMIAKALFWLNRVCEPALRPFQKILPPAGGLDLSPILLIILIGFCQNLLTGLSRHGDVVYPLLALLSNLLNLYMLCMLLLGVINSMVTLKMANPYQPVIQALIIALRRLCDPVVKHFRRFIPRHKGIDLPVFTVVIIIYIVDEYVQHLMHVV
ncbi:MAG: YggT family protein [Rickettsiales bacterium]|nr:YggT family protein [Rickettsiales bacterium]